MSLKSQYPNKKVGASASPQHHVSASFFSREFTCFNHGQFDSHCSSALRGVWLIISGKYTWHCDEKGRMKEVDLSAEESSAAALAAGQ